MKAEDITGKGFGRLRGNWDGRVLDGSARNKFANIYGHGYWRSKRAGRLGWYLYISIEN
jgi:hypothetical protein